MVYFIRFLFLCVSLGGLNISGAAPLQPLKPAVKKYNILFIAVDDLRPELGCYGNKEVKSPNINKLAAGGVVFKKHYVTVPTCGASRYSLLTGRLPRSTTELNNDVIELKRAAGIKEKGPESFVHYLRQNGYYTTGIGKISHSPDGYIYKYLEPKSTVAELPQSWHEMLLDPGKWQTGWNAFFGYADGSNRNTVKGLVKPYESAPVSDSDYPDGLTANLAVKKIKELAQRKEPFFLGVGFFKPHLPFNAPQKYWDLYEETKISLPPFSEIPQNINPLSLHQSSEFNSYKAGDEKASLAQPVSEAYARKLRHGYYASISYTDAQIGLVLAELKKQGLDKNTIIILWGDHGWHLGDDRVWGKHTLSEWALRSALVIKAPGKKIAATSNHVVSSIDIYPTLMELCNLKMPYPMPGKSLVPLLQDPAAKNWQNMAYSYYQRGISMRTDNHRFTQYFRKAEPVQELYHYPTDPYETINIAGKDPETVKKLMPAWQKGNTGLFEQVAKENPASGVKNQE